MSQHQLVTLIIAGQVLGIPIARVQDAFSPQAITAVPRAPAQVAGLMNFRGYIVTAISLRDCLALPPSGGSGVPIAIGVEHRGELYGLLVNEMGEVLTPDPGTREENPANLDPKWQRVSACVYRLRDKLLVELDVDRLLDFSKLAA